MKIKEARRRGYYVEDEDGHARIHSKYDPRREAKRRLPDEPSDEGRYIIAGAGLGYVLDELASLDPDAKVLVLEPNPQLLSDGRERDIWDPQLLEQIQVISDDTDNYSDAVGSFLPLKQHDQFELISWKQYQEQHGGFFRQCLEAISRVQNLHRESLKVLRSQGPTWLRHARRNLPLLKQHVRPTPASLDQTICLVSAGPSLDRQLDWLKNNGESTVVFSGNTAGPPLRKHGIDVDAHVAVDANEPVADDLKHSRLNHLMISPFVEPTIAEDADVPVTVLGVKTPLTEWLESAGFLPTIQPGGAISATMLNWLSNQTTRRIVLLGCDMEFRFGRYYARGTHREERGIDSLNRFNSPPGWHLEKYRENQEKNGLDNEREWFVDQSRHQDNLTVPTCPPSWWEGRVDGTPVSSEAADLTFKRPDSRVVNNWFTQQLEQISRLLAGRDAHDHWATFEHWVHQITEEPRTELESWKKTFESLVE